MANENNKAALLQFGVSMMQPVGLGQSPMGHVGEAIGGAGEAMTRRGDINRKDEEAASKADLRTAQATVAEARAANAGQGAARAGDRLEMARDRLAWDREKYGTQNLIRVQGQYIRDRKAHDDNQIFLPPAQRSTFPDFDKWTAQNPSLATALGTGGTGGGSSSDAGSGEGTSSAQSGGGGGTPPVSALKEGSNTRFKNGQSWTLLGGQPVRVQ